MKRTFYLPSLALAVVLTYCPSQSSQIQEKKSERLEERVTVREYTQINRRPESAVEMRYVKYLLNEIGASQLHPSIFSLERPTMEVVIDNERFYVEAYNGNLKVSRKKLEKIDIRISSSSEELRKILASEDIMASIRNSVSNKKINLEIMTGRIKLFSKGYMGIYNNLSEK